MPDWTSLPVEIHDEILAKLLHYKDVARYAAVSRQWRCFFEKRNFSHLDLGEEDLDTLQRLSTPSKALIQHLKLNIRLADYACDLCCQSENADYYEANNEAVAVGIANLFNVLARFPTKQGEDERQQHLTVELNAYSLCDKLHWFPNCYFGFRGENEDELDSLEVTHDPSCGWWRQHEPISGTWLRQYGKIPVHALSRPFVTALLEIHGSLPLVPAVTKFIIRRQCRRQLNPLELSYIWSRLPQLQEIRYEPWLLPDMASQDKRDQALPTILGDQLPQSVKTVTIFEDFNESYNDTFQAFHVREQGLHVSWKRQGVPRMSTGFATHSQKLENLSLASVVDARDFFDACEQEPLWRWDQLRSLQLTSAVMNKSERTFISGLIESAGRVALRMPKLQTMTLWNGARGVACSFTWSRAYALLVCRGNFAYEVSHAAIVAWKKLAYEYCRREVDLRQHFFAHKIRSHGDAVYHLGLDTSVLDKLSLRQIRKENNFEEEVPDLEEEEDHTAGEVDEDEPEEDDDTLDGQRDRIGGEESDCDEGEAFFDAQETSVMEMVQNLGERFIY